MSMIDTLEKHTPHLDSMLPYGYRFKGIVIYRVTTEDRQDLDLYAELDETHNVIGSMDAPRNSPHMQRILWEISSHIEGNFGPPFEAVIVERTGYITIHVRKDCRWWNSQRVNYKSLVSNYLMGLRSLLDLLK